MNKLLILDHPVANLSTEQSVRVTQTKFVQKPLNTERRIATPPGKKKYFESVLLLPVVLG